MTVRELCEKCVNTGCGKVVLFNDYDNHLALADNYQNLNDFAKNLYVLEWSFDYIKGSNIDMDFCIHMKVSMDEK